MDEDYPAVDNDPAPGSSGRSQACRRVRSKKLSRERFRKLIAKLFCLFCLQANTGM